MTLWRILCNLLNICICLRNRKQMSEKSASLSVIITTVLCIVGSNYHLQATVIVHTQPPSKYQEIQHKLNNDVLLKTKQFFYPTCSIKEGSSLRMLNICLLRESWAHDLVMTFENGNNRRVLDLFGGSGSQRPEPEKYSFAVDCLHDVRNSIAQRPFPKNCFYDKLNLTFNEYIHNWWSFYSSDFSYTFDFVLWDLDGKTKVNQFWYITLYIKSLVSFIDNPFAILTQHLYAEDRSNLELRLFDVLNRYAQYQRRSIDMEMRINKLAESLSRFHADQLVLINQLNEMTINLERLEIDRNISMNKIKEIGSKTTTIRTKLKQFSEAAHKKFHPNKEYNIINLPPDVQNIKDIHFPANVVNMQQNHQVFKLLIPEIPIPIHFG